MDGVELLSMKSNLIFLQLTNPDKLSLAVNESCQA